MLGSSVSVATPYTHFCTRLARAGSAAFTGWYFISFTPMNVARPMNTEFIRKRYSAPKK